MKKYIKEFAILIAAASTSLVLTTATALAEGVANQGLALHGAVKYPATFKNFDYANPDAPKGGSITLTWMGSFDTLNPYALKGTPPLLLGSLVFQELGESSLDEPISTYPTLAESFDLAADQLSMVIKLREEATFSDGKPVTSDDVIFSFDLLRSDKVPPNYKFYWADIKKLEKLDNKRFKMIFVKVNPELPIIATQIPVLPKHVYGKGDFNKDFNDKVVGSGPYLVDKYTRGSTVVYKRNPKFWGVNLAAFKGRYNFDEISIKYFTDPTAQAESFKKGDFDLYEVYSAKAWARDLTGERFEKLKWIKKANWPHQNNQGSQGYIFNLKLSIFQDIRVRQAIALAFDFDWLSKNLFFGQYKESYSYFENSPLKAKGMPSSEELKILEPLKADIPVEVFTKEVGSLGKGMDIKMRLKEANRLLKEAGYHIKKGVASGPGGALSFKFLNDGGGWDRVLSPYIQNLKRIGVDVAIDTKEESVMIQKLESRDFAMTIIRIGQSQSPGNEQLDFWSSAAADEKLSRNYMSLKNKAVDALIEKIVYAKTREDLELYTKCLDRVLYHLHISVHNWHTDTHRVAYWDRYGIPKVLPPFYSVRQLMEYMWEDPVKAKALDAARSANKAL